MSINLKSEVGPSRDVINKVDAAVQTTNENSKSIMPKVVTALALAAITGVASYFLGNLCSASLNEMIRLGCGNENRSWIICTPLLAKTSGQCFSAGLTSVGSGAFLVDNTNIQNTISLTNLVMKFFKFGG